MLAPGFAQHFMDALLDVRVIRGGICFHGVYCQCAGPEISTPVVKLIFRCPIMSGAGVMCRGDGQLESGAFKCVALRS
jgi:hypothetical protein